MLCEVQGVHKSYQPSDGNRSVQVLAGVNLTIPERESIAVVGPSGSGKTTLLNILGTLSRPDKGKVVLEGKDISLLSEDELSRLRNHRIGIVFQKHLLLPPCTVLENVLVPTLAWPSGKDRKRNLDRALQLLERVGLAKRLHHRPDQLSGGECQRVALVRALINRPALLCADEPTGSLDQESARSLGQLLTDINKEEGTTLVVVTHSHELAMRMDRRLRLRDKVLVEDTEKPQMHTEIDTDFHR